MTDNFKEIGSLFGREGAGAGFAKQTERNPSPMLSLGRMGILGQPSPDT